MMSRPVLAAAVCYCWLVAHIAPACAPQLYAQLFPLTGEIRLLNRDPAPVPFVFYSIASASGVPGNRVDGMLAVVHSVLFWGLNVVLTPLILLATLFTDRKRTVHDLLLGTVVTRTVR